MENLNYKIVFVTSQTEKNPISNILNHSPYSDGWNSIPFSVFPQEIILDFLKPVRIKELKIVSHQIKIPNEIEILILNDNNWKNKKFKKISSTKFTDNLKNDFKCREIKCAHFPSIRLRYLLIRINNIHFNQLNKTNQVGIISILTKGIIENIIEEDPEILLLEEKKQNAIENENFTLAQEIKNQINFLKSNKNLINNLEKQKNEAIINEDFELAKKIKIKILEILNNKNNLNIENSEMTYQQETSFYESEISKFKNYTENNIEESSQYLSNNEKKNILMILKIDQLKLIIKMMKIY